MKPEIVQMSEAEYHADPLGVSLSASIANILLTQSAEHAWAAHPKLGGLRRPPTKSMDLGTLGHSVLLQSNDKRISVPRAAVDVYVYKGTKREQLRYRAGEAFRDYGLEAAQEARKDIEAAGGISVLQHEVDDAAAMAEVARRKFKPHWLIADPQAHQVERVVLWEEQASNGMLVQCRARMDLVDERTGEAEDLKCVADARYQKCCGHVESYGGAVQHGGYVSALEHAWPTMAGRIEYRWVFVETDQPHAVRRCGPAGTMRHVGAAMWRIAVDRWAECLSSGNWPGYNDDETEIEASARSLERVLEMEEGREAA